MSKILRDAMTMQRILGMDAKSAIMAICLWVAGVLLYFPFEESFGDALRTLPPSTNPLE